MIIPLKELTIIDTKKSPYKAFDGSMKDSFKADVTFDGLILLGMKISEEVFKEIDGKKNFECIGGTLEIMGYKGDPTLKLLSITY